ncbi:hypothetical protein [Streptomyces sp. NPDC048224]|uniref:hypothetical protein n=1 Tax=unclassified Streptomyces TaxID=2593676 RepID=UPI00340B4DA3
MGKRSARALHRSATGALAVVTGLALLCGCGLSDHRETGSGSGGTGSAQPSVAPKAPVPPGKPLGPDAHVPDTGVVDEDDATAVSEAWAETTYGYDTAYDTSPQDAVLRGVRWCTERKAAAERQYRPASGPGNEWTTWAGHRAWTTVDVSSELEDDAPPDGERIAYRSLVVSGTAHGRDGWEGAGPRLNAYVKLVRAGVGDPWRVDDVTVVEAARPPAPSTPASAGSPSDDSRQ